MQRILYCTDYLTAGGTEHQLVALVTRLDRRRFEPHVLCLYGARAGRSLHFLESLRSQNIPVSVLDLGWQARDKLHGIAEIVRQVWRIRPHIVQAVNYHSNLLMRLARPFLPRSLKLIGCVYVEYTPKQLLYERISAWLCAAVVCNSPQLQAQLSAHLPSRQIELIPNGIDLERFALNPAPLLRNRLTPSVQRALLFMGRITTQKSPHLLVEALGILKRRDALPLGTVAWIVGESEEPSAQRQIDDSVDRCGLRDVIFQFPPTAAPEVFYAAADVTVLPSLWEGLPNVLLESLAVGCPVVVSEAGNAAGVIAHKSNGWVVPTGDVEQLANMLCAVLALPDSDLLRMRSSCYEAAVPFAMAKMVQSYETLYRRLSARS